MSAEPRGAVAASGPPGGLIGTCTSGLRGHASLTTEQLVGDVPAHRQLDIAVDFPTDDRNVLAAIFRFVHSLGEQRPIVEDIGVRSVVE